MAEVELEAAQSSLAMRMVRLILLLSGEILNEHIEERRRIRRLAVHKDTGEVGAESSSPRLLVGRLPASLFPEQVVLEDSHGQGALMVGRIEDLFSWGSIFQRLCIRPEIFPAGRT